MVMDWMDIWKPLIFWQKIETIACQMVLDSIKYTRIVMRTF